MNTWRGHLGLCWLLVLGIDSLCPVTSWAVELSLPASEPNVSAIVPSGACRGTAVNITVTGTNLSNAKGVRLTGAGVSAELVPAADGKAATATQLTIRLTADEKAEPGPRELRIETSGGVSNVARFEIGTYPEITENEPNDTPATSMQLTQFPVVVNGILNKNEDRDVFRFSARAGQKIVFDLEAQPLHPLVGTGRPGWLEGFLSIREITNLATAVDTKMAADAVVAEKAKISKSAATALKNAESAMQKAVDKSAAKKAEEKLASAQTQATNAAAELAAANRVAAEHKANVEKLAELPNRILKYSQGLDGREDPLLVFDVPKDGEYAIEVRDELYRGRADFNYRLTIGEIPRVLAVFPAGMRLGETTTVKLTGVNLGSNTETQVQSPPESTEVQLRQRVAAKSGTSNDFNLQLGRDREILEAEPNSNPEQAQAIEIPAMLNGVIQNDGDLDQWAFAAKKGERVIFETFSRTLGSPLDARLELVDDKGRRLKESDDANSSPDAFIDHTFTADGNYRVIVSDITGYGSDRHVYRLNVRNPRPDFSLRVSPDRPRVAAGGTAVLKVLIQRRDGFTGDIELFVPNPPEGASIGTAIATGTTAEQIVTVTMPKDAPLGSQAVTVLGRSKIGDEEVTHSAQPVEPIRFNNDWRYISVNDTVLTVLPTVPVTLAWGQPSANLLTGETVSIPIRIHREEGFAAPVRVVLDGLPQRVTAPPVTIAEGTDEGIIEIRAASSVAANVYNIVANATLTLQGKSFVQSSPALQLSIEAAPKNNKK